MLALPRSALVPLVAGLLFLARPLPVGGQTVIHDSAPTPAPTAAQAAQAAQIRALLDSLRAHGDTLRLAPPRSDTTARAAQPAPSAAAAAAPAPAPTGPPPPRGVCGPDADPVSAEVLLVTFRARSTPAQRQDAVKSVKGTIVAPDPTDPASAYVRVPSDGNEFVLRAIADRLIRTPAVKEVGPVQCPAAR